jgi:hypothetical protein
LVADSVALREMALQGLNAIAIETLVVIGRHVNTLLNVGVHQGSLFGV